MAFSPCAVGGHRYSGGANTGFLRVVNGADSTGGKRQYCPNHATEILQWLDEHAIKVSVGDDFYEFDEPLSCLACGQDWGLTPWKLYANLFFRSRLPGQYYGVYCLPCAMTAAEELHLGAPSA